MSEESNSTPPPPPTEDQPIQSSAISIYTPIIYVAILLTTLIVFSISHRKKKFKKLTTLAPIFSESYPKEIYLELKYQTDPKVNEKVLKAALIRRGAESLRRMIKLKETEPFVNALYQKGSIGDEVFERYKIQAKLQELEMQELAMEAEGIKKGWAQTFFPVCQEVTINEALRRRLNATEERGKILSMQWLDDLEKKVEVTVQAEIENGSKVNS
ncbi:hypothetical protein CANARDRAFT_10281 [[Candida] arabinofermentans NRRL YB-2248]|uniref:Translocation protein SEC66 n=1 Tax=[Candida] arabinofermentans NRRL YB-2248 TaxID=983967 RepID=A0A1E4STC2_9ASCO|nr:hypothetical protein CANARDRAFT_10281 [[Candida] arabinofermentans NRRL YB-2248]